MDIWTKEKRSRVMSRILGRNTTPELTVGRMLRGLGCRYRLHVASLVGKPDIVMRRNGIVIFVHGCFWHLHSTCRDGTMPKSRASYWTGKLLRNRERDTEHLRSLRQEGWKVIRLWECEIEKKPVTVMNKLRKSLTARNVNSGFAIQPPRDLS